MIYVSPFLPSLRDHYPVYFPDLFSKFVKVCGGRGQFPYWIHLLIKTVLLIFFNKIEKQWSTHTKRDLEPLRCRLKAKKFIPEQYGRGQLVARYYFPSRPISTKQCWDHCPHPITNILNLCSRTCCKHIHSNAGILCSWLQHEPVTSWHFMNTLIEVPS